jgi:hypothetical protein
VDQTLPIAVEHIRAIVLHHTLPAVHHTLIAVEHIRPVLEHTFPVAVAGVRAAAESTLGRRLAEHRAEDYDK